MAAAAGAGAVEEVLVGRGGSSTARSSIVRRGWSRTSVCCWKKEVCAGEGVRRLACSVDAEVEDGLARACISGAAPVELLTAAHWRTEVLGEA